MCRAQSRTSYEKLTQISNKAGEYESQFINEINIRGTREIAEFIGIDRSQLSRWKRTHIPKFSRFLAFIGFEPQAIAMKEVARELYALMQEQGGRLSDAGDTRKPHAVSTVTKRDTDTKGIVHE